MAITVTALSTTAVKGTRIRSVESVTLDEGGARGDRAFYVVDADGALVNGKRVGLLQTVVADYDMEAGTLALRFPNGEATTDAVRLGDAVDTRFFSKPRRARALDGPWADALSRFAGQPLALVAAEVGVGVDRGRGGAASLVSRGSLARLARADTPFGARGGGAPVDARRFRMLIEVDGIAAHEEDRWVGCVVAVGGARLRMQGNVGRCVTTTRGPETGEVDLPTLKMLSSYRRDEATTEPLAFGVYGEVVEAGVVRVGDTVMFEG